MFEPYIRVVAELRGSYAELFAAVAKKLDLADNKTEIVRQAIIALAKEKQVKVEETKWVTN